MLTTSFVNHSEKQNLDPHLMPHRNIKFQRDFPVEKKLWENNFVNYDTHTMGYNTTIYENKSELHESRSVSGFSLYLLLRMKSKMQKSM